MLNEDKKYKYSQIFFLSHSGEESVFELPNWELRGPDQDK